MVLGGPDLSCWWQTLRLKFGQWSMVRGLELGLAILELPVQAFLVVYMLSYQVRKWTIDVNRANCAFLKRIVGTHFKKCLNVICILYMCIYMYM